MLQGPTGIYYRDVRSWILFPCLRGSQEYIICRDVRAWILFPCLRGPQGYIIEM